MLVAQVHNLCAADYTSLHLHSFAFHCYIQAIAHIADCKPLLSIYNESKLQKGVIELRIERGHTVSYLHSCVSTTSEALILRDTHQHLKTKVLGMLTGRVWLCLL